MERGIFLSFEGTEGSGKSTLIQLVARRLQEHQQTVVITREPGGTELAEALRTLILHPNPEESPPSPLTELLLLEAARADHIARVIRPALERGDVVLCDRFTDSTLAYQSFARKLPWKDVGLANQLATSGLKPNLIVFLDLDPATGLLRAKDPNRFEAEGVAFQTQVRKGFLKARAQNRKHWLTLHSDREDPAALADQVLAAPIFKARLRKPNP